MMGRIGQSRSGIRRTVAILAVIATCIYLLFIAAGIFGFRAN
jgi:hypothetical protein